MSLVPRAIAIILLLSLIAPFVFLNPIAKVSAGSLFHFSQTPAAVSAPPEEFVAAESGAGLSSLLDFSENTGLGIVLAEAGKKVADLMTGKSKIPAGLEQSEGKQLRLSESQAASTTTLMTLPSGSVRFDFTGDGKADVGRWKPSNTVWQIKDSTTGGVSAATFGTAFGVVAPGDFDGDGRTDYATFASGTWKIRKSSMSWQTLTISFGAAGDRPAVGDYDGDGKADVTVFRPSNGTWYILNSSNGSTTSTAFGQASDIVVQGNYDGDSKTDIAVWRNGNWFVLNSSSGSLSSFVWGLPSDVPVPTDYDGDGKTDYAVFRGSTGHWYAVKSSTGNSQYFAQNWGNYGDQPVPADYDGDGKDDFAVWRATTGVWYILKSSDGSYTATTFGAAGEVAVSSAYIKQIGSYVYSYDFAKARLAPKNATGGTDLYSRNFSWGTSLVGLSGRAGMDAGFGISYNSLIWTKDAASNTIVFDADAGSISPGFRFGFATIESAYYDATTGKFSYMMVTPSGARVEFRQTAASDTYETADSSYTQLKINGAANPNDPAETLTLTITATDGTQMLYAWQAGLYRCQKITDRNGNYITFGHNSYNGVLQSVTDTLGRVINVNYDADTSPTSITQTWNAGNGAGTNITHTWATLSYTYITIGTNFSNALTVIGPNGISIKVLQKITYADGSYTTFDYNSWGQVKQVNNYAADNHKLNHVRVNLPDNASSQQSDCPRFTETRQYVENFNSNQETVITNSLTENQTYSLPGGLTGTATKIEVGLQGDPSGHISKTFVGGSGWKEGLPIATEDWANGTGGLERKRWTWTNWTQDDPNLSYIQNPRVIESKVGDATNIKRATTEYYPIAQNSPIALYGLVKEVKVYDTNQTSVLKKATTEYNLADEYLSRRIIGLPSKVEVWGQNQQTSQFEKVSEVTYAYDDEDFTQETNQNISPIQHEYTFDENFVVGRGNLTATTRHDVTGVTASATSRVRYDIAGSPVAKLDALNRKTRIEYTDAFNDTQNRYTYAYPTSIITPNQYNQLVVTSSVKYRFDTGANVWAKSPAPAGNTTGKETTRLYDSLGRPEKETLVNTGAYTRYEYPTNGIQSKSYSTIVDTNNNGADATDEVMSESWADGAGRVRKSRTLHPNSTGGWTGSLVEYDLLGQVKRASVPTEINADYEPAGDDATRGWLWTYKKYDWKGRVTRIINTDGTDSPTLNDSDQLFSYEGCGCAGGEVVTMESELVPRDDLPNTNARRKQKVYSDILGRQFKTEVYKWDGTTVYSTVQQTFNGRDQVVSSAQTDNSQNPVVTQNTTATFDGHGRLKTSHRPEQQLANGNPAYTTYNYNPDDSISSVMDARGATTNYTYGDPRGLLTQINTTMPSAPEIPVEPPPSSGTSSPIGFLDSIGGVDWKAKGWSLDPDNPNQSNIIHFYIDGPAGQGTYIGQATADLPRPDVNTATGYPGNHGFEFVIPNQYLNGAPHTLYAYGLDTGADNPKLLNGSPMHFTYGSNNVQPQLTSTVNIGYDNTGNRLWMTDNLGRTDYEYDPLSRLKSETRKITDTTANGSPLTMPHAPLPDNGFKLQYTYGLAGQLKSLTDPFGAVINYGHDAVGRLTDVTGSSFGGVTTYANNAEYRAWGGLKELNYGSTLQSATSYNNRLLPASYNLSGGANNQVMNRNYDYYADGSLKYMQDVINPIFDRLNIYDHAGRIKQGKTGLEARGGTVTDFNTQKTSLPYRQSYQFNGFNNLTQRNNLHWGIETWNGQNNNLNYTYNNNRIQSGGWLYDADGRNIQSSTPDEYSSSKYDASGRMVRSTTGETDAVRFYDGNSREIKRMTSNYAGETNGSPYWLINTKYYIRSSVLGNEVVSEVWSNGRKRKTFVQAADTKLGYQAAYASESATLSEAVMFEFTDASGTSQRTTDKNGFYVATGDGGDGSPVETDPFGGNVGSESPYHEPLIYQPAPEYPFLELWNTDAPTYINGQQVTATLDGFPISLGRAMSLMEHGAAIPASLAWAQGLSGFNFQSHGLGIFTVNIPGHYHETAPGGRDDADTIYVGSTVQHPAQTHTFYFGNASWNFWDCIPGLPCPQKRPTPTPAPTPEPKPKPTCFTYADFFQLKEVRDNLDGAWKDTQNDEEFVEHGGWMFLDSDRNAYYVRRHTKGTRHRLPEDEPEQFLKAQREIRDTGAKVRFFVQFHTHPSGGLRSGADVLSIAIPSKSNSQGNYNALGVIVTGVGKYTFYDRTGEIYEGSLKERCLPYQ